MLPSPAANLGIYPAAFGEIKVPVIVRLQGTNAEAAKELIEKSGLKVQSAILLSEAAELVNKAVA